MAMIDRNGIKRLSKILRDMQETDEFPKALKVHVHFFKSRFPVKEVSAPDGS